MKIFKHPLFWMAINAIAMIYTINTDVILNLTEREYRSSLLVIFPIIIISFIILIISFILEIYLYLNNKGREIDAREVISSNERQEERDVYESQGSDIQRGRLSLYEERRIHL